MVYFLDKLYKAHKEYCYNLIQSHVTNIFRQKNHYYLTQIGNNFISFTLIPTQTIFKVFMANKSVNSSHASSWRVLPIRTRISNFQTKDMLPI